MWKTEAFQVLWNSYLFFMRTGALNDHSVPIGTVSVLGLKYLKIKMNKTYNLPNRWESQSQHYCLQLGTNSGSKEKKFRVNHLKVYSSCSRFLFIFVLFWIIYFLKYYDKILTVFPRTACGHKNSRSKNFRSTFNRPRVNILFLQFLDKIDRHRVKRREFH